MFEEIGVFYRGLVLGLMIAAPIGPIGLLCIRRTIRKGLLTGFATGFGAACADTVFGAIATLGVAAILEFIHHYNASIRCIGGAFLLFIAWHIWRDRPKEPLQDPSVSGMLKAVASGFIITMTNPLTIFGIMAVIATFANLQRNHDAVVLVSGIFTGSLLWWLVLSGGVALVRSHVTETRIIYINRVMAVAMAGLAAAAIGTGIAVYLH